MIETDDSSGQDQTAGRIGTAWRGQYILMDVLGVGGTASVYLSALDDGTEVAVKVLHREWLQDAEIRGAFEFESKLLEHLAHPGLPTVLGAGELPGGEPYYVMERLQGALLSDVLARRGGKLSAADTCHVIDRTLEVLFSLHETGVVHRDIKPSNLFITLQGTVKLLDLGAALLLDDVERAPAQRLIGSPSYMAPEQATNATLGVDRRSDVFAMGATMFHMLSGQPIRSAGTVDELFTMASTVPAPSVARVNPELGASIVRVVDRALAWVPIDRYPDASAMLEAVRRAAADDNVGASALAVAGGDALRQALGMDASDEGERPAGERAKIQVTLREFFRKLSRCILGARRYAPDSPEYLERFGPAREALEQAFREIGGDLDLVIRPYAFEFEELPVWEPEVGLEDVPYFMFQSGFRGVRFRTDLENAELVRFCKLMSLDPMRDLPFEDDLSTVFFEGGFEAIEANILSGFDVDILDHYESFGQQVKQLTQELEREAKRNTGSDKGMADLAAALGRQGVSEADAIEMNFDSEDAALSLWRTDGLDWWPSIPESTPDLELRWRERGIRAVAHAYHRAIADRQPALILDRVRDRVLQLSQGAAIPDALLLLSNLAQQCEPSAMQHMLDFCLLDDLAEKLMSVASTPRPQWSDSNYVLSPAFEAFLARLPDRLIEPAVEVWMRQMDDASADVFMNGLATRLKGNEIAFAKALPRAPEPVAIHILRWMSAHEEVSMTRFIAQALENSAEYVRAAALSVLMPRGFKPVDKALESLLRSSESRSRRTALRLIEMYKPDGMAATLEGIAREPRFHDLPLAERQAIFVTLHRVAHSQTRLLLAELIKPAGWGREASGAPTRKLAADLLAALYPDVQTIEMLDKEIKRFFRTPPEVRDAMSKSLNDLRQKLATENGR